MVPGEQWMPYQAPNVVTPPFPEYTSGHSTFSAAARIAFTGTDNFGAKVTIKAGTSLFEPRTATNPGTPARDVTLSWKTFMDAADRQAGRAGTAASTSTAATCTAGWPEHRSAGRSTTRPRPTGREPSPADRSGQQTPARHWS
jgi:hypothetical protein